ncbi:hypothetical protein FA09DRAFT_332241 [Tilletiopsis washingtonensis]|uniref:Uncharacterized protein n=1 Tax=Tilletiopsis washingtonensis TaxID=58919 RepID=A0A316Z1V1_9BASI|nr:hypothetical protein FA09DRAFT_332241 [Tilletiopsis washingtonensis]PWN95336.1 hypothetical protein FA09DRAFT_332241 [Tilletiopsis washingtonensis]
MWPFSSSSAPAASTSAQPAPPPPPVEVAPPAPAPPPPSEAPFQPPAAAPATLPPSLPFLAAALGLSTGIYSGASRAAKVFMAENAHRQPTTVQGWFFYNKTKNYKVVLSALGAGIARGARLGAWSGAFVGLHAGIGYLLPAPVMQSTRDDRSAELINAGAATAQGAGAGVLLAAGAAVIYKLPRASVRRSLVLGLGAGGAVGLLETLRSRVARAREEAEREETR